MEKTAGKTLLAAVVLILITFAAYLPAIRGGFIWDDDDYVTGNRHLRTNEGLGRIWFDLKANKQYYPLVHTSFWMEYHLWGLNPLGYHLVNVILHALNAVLLWMLLRQLSVPGSFLAAAIFALHPVHVESVAWITERKNVLSCFFYLSAALAYFRMGLDSETARASHKPPKRAAGQMPVVRSKGRYFASLLFFACALLSKTVALSLPAAILLVVWWKRGRLTRLDVVPLIPMFILGAILGWITAWLEKYNVGAVGAEWHLSAIERLLIAGRALWFYAGKLLLPFDLAFIYPRWQINASAPWQYLFPASILALAAFLWLARNRIGRGTLATALIFGGTLVPALGFFDVYPMQYSFVADHFQYHASIGLIALFAAVCVQGMSQCVSGRIWPVAAAIMLVAGLAMLTWRQSHVYTSLEILYRDTLSKNPACVMAHQNFGALLMDSGRVGEAQEHFADILRLEPKNADALANMGLALFLSGRTDQAVAHYQKALAIEPHQVDALNNLAWIRATYPDERHRNGLEAVRLAQLACAVIKEKSAPYLDTLAAAYAESGRFEESISSIEEAISLAREIGQNTNVETYLRRLALYRSRQPYRETRSP